MAILLHTKLCAGRTALALSLLFGAPGTLRAQPGGRSSGIGKSPAAVSLAGAMRAISPSRDVAIAVGAEKISLAKGSPAPEPGLPLSQTVTSFDYTARRFGTVVAVAPQTMVVLGANFAQADIYKDIPPRIAFNILAASLTDAQRQAMLDEKGVGLDDLTTPMQRGLFLTLFPTQLLTVSPRAIPGQPPSGPDQQHDISNPMQNARLRVGASTRMVVHTIGHETPGLTPVFGAENGPRIYAAANQKHLFSADTVDGVQVRWTEANVLKKSQLDFERTALQQRIPLDELKTVGDLIARIAGQTKIELYADRHYETRSLTILNAGGSARAADLLRSLCLCVTGAFRRVGPAYVLTDDIAGVGARRQQITEFQADGDAQRAGLLQQAEDYLQKSGALWKVKPSAFGDPMMPTDEQLKKDDTDVLGAGTIAVIKLPFDQLTPVQQHALQQHSADMAKLHEANPNDGHSLGIDFDKPIELNVIPSIQLLLPGVDGPVDTGLGEFVAETFHDMSKWRRPRGHKEPAAVPAESTGPPLAELTAGIQRRALLANCGTAEELDNIVAKMIKIGLNELWLPVFFNGVANVSGTPFTSPDAHGSDLLAHAVKITRASGIAVYTVFDLLTWGASTSKDLADLTIMGETSARDAERRRSLDAYRAAANGDPPPGSASRRLIVSPLAASVPRDLSVLLKTVAARQGIAGLVWRETCPPGYDLPATIHHIEPGGRLGYTEAARLAFLRQSHSDPIDIAPRRGYGFVFERADTSLPNFDDYDLDKLLDEKWKEACTQVNVGLLTALYSATEGILAAGNKTGDNPKRAEAVVFVRERRDNFGTTWYGAWGGPNTPLPTNHMSFEESEAGSDLHPAADAPEQARSQSRINLVRLPTGKSLEESLLKQQWADAIKELKKNKNWDGFVFEMEPIHP